MSIKDKDFVELDYTGSLKDGEIFDTTNPTIAKDRGLHVHETHGPVIICIGQRQIVKGIEEALIGKNEGDSFELDVPADKAFGKKDATLFTMMPMSKFREQNIKPYPGLQLHIDDAVGIVKTVHGGRIMVDFNHPLAAKTLHYNVSIKRVLTDKKEKLVAALKNLFGLQNVMIEDKDMNTVVTLPKSLPEQAAIMLSKKLQELTGMERIIFEEDKALEKKEAKPHVHGPDCAHD